MHIRSLEINSGPSFYFYFGGGGGNLGCNLLTLIIYFFDLYRAFLPKGRILSAYHEILLIGAFIIS